METTKAVVRPGPSLSGQTVKLSPIDQIAPRDYTVIFLFFKLDRNVCKRSIFRNLEIGLLNTSKEIPQILTSVAKCKSDRDELELVYSPDVGATIVFKDYTTRENGLSWPHGSFDEMEAKHFPPSQLDTDLLLGIETSSNSGFIPTLIFQANFIDGGLILSRCLHHTLCDGKSGFLLQEVFARHTAAAAMSFVPPPLCTVKAGQISSQCEEISFTERTTLISPIQEVFVDEFPNWRLADTESRSINPVPQETNHEPEVQFALCFISEASMRRLRAKLEPVVKSRLSVCDALGAFLWVHVLRARNIDSKKYPNARLSITVDARSRMTDQVVTPTYWGNLCEPNAVASLPTAFLLGGRDTAAAETTSTSPNTTMKHFHTDVDWLSRLPNAAVGVRKAITAVDSTAVRRLVGILNQMPKATSLTWNVDRWPGPDMLIVAMNQMPFNNAYYGPELGMSEACRITVGTARGKPDGRCLLLPPRAKDGRGVEIALYYDVATLERLRQSQCFREFIEWRN